MSLILTKCKIFAVSQKQGIAFGWMAYLYPSNCDNHFVTIF